MEQKNINNTVIPAKAGIHMDPDLHRGDDDNKPAIPSEVGGSLRCGRDYSSGFTLVELAIALMVIGLLIGGVLKGQELIENARVTQTVRQFQAFEAAVMIFRNTYNALPGDIKRPSRIPNCIEELCLTAGNGNGMIKPAGAYSDILEETINVFPHLTKAGMIQGPTGAEDMDSIEPELVYPALPIDSITQVRTVHQPADTTSGDGMRLPQAGHYYELYPVPVKYASALDEKMDDGYPEKGLVQEESNQCVNYDETDKPYNLDSDWGCTLYVRTGF